jgi:hypothetical protein
LFSGLSEFFGGFLYAIYPHPPLRGDEVSDTWQLTSAIQDGDDDQTLWNDYSR